MWSLLDQTDVLSSPSWTWTFHLGLICTLQEWDVSHSGSMAECPAFFNVCYCDSLGQRCHCNAWEADFSWEHSLRNLHFRDLDSKLLRKAKCHRLWIRLYTTFQGEKTNKKLLGCSQWSWNSVLHRIRGVYPNLNWLLDIVIQILIKCPFPK